MFRPRLPLYSSMLRCALGLCVIVTLAYKQTSNLPPTNKCPSHPRSPLPLSLLSPSSLLPRSFLSIYSHRHVSGCKLARRKHLQGHDSLQCRGRDDIAGGRGAWRARYCPGRMLVLFRSDRTTHVPGNRNQDGRMYVKESFMRTRARIYVCFLSALIKNGACTSIVEQ